MLVVELTVTGWSTNSYDDMVVIVSGVESWSREVLHITMSDIVMALSMSSYAQAVTCLVTYEPSKKSFVVLLLYSRFCIE